MTVTLKKLMCVWLHCTSTCNGWIFHRSSSDGVQIKEQWTFTSYAITGRRMLLWAELLAVMWACMIQLSFLWTNLPPKNLWSVFITSKCFRTINCVILIGQTELSQGFFFPGPESVGGRRKNVEAGEHYLWADDTVLFLSFFRMGRGGGGGYSCDV